MDGEPQDDLLGALRLVPEPVQGRSEGYERNLSRLPLAPDPSGTSCSSG